MSVLKPMNKEQVPGYSVLTANVGNLNIGCRKYLNNLCYLDVEERISQSIRKLRPDIVTLQEIMAPWQCADVQERNPKKVCHYEQLVAQARRLLGDDYTIVCDMRGHFTCIGVHVDIGEVLGCEKGSYCPTARTGHALDGCDNGFTVSAATVRTNDNLVFDVVNAHLQSTSAQCREKMLKLTFDGNENSPPLIQEEKVLIMGDFNFDPWRDHDDISVIKWQSYMGRGWRGTPLRYHSGAVETTPPRFTSYLLWRGKTVDLVVSNFLDGTCVVLGETPGTHRLDGSRGMDHRGVYGVLTIRE
ncbi:MAG: endonuclease/exonuclease/phosphatase family protein [Gammaproteobacteria bacterium]|nr:MAG: endonuclease/exonuclease/phosphatase family protein [Gammaproteobacteria bacterium]